MVDLGGYIRTHGVVVPELTIALLLGDDLPASSRIPPHGGDAGVDDHAPRAVDLDARVLPGPSPPLEHAADPTPR